MTPPSSRDGFSLMEVLIATSILLASVIVLGELASIGRRQAGSARDLATAQNLCENKLNEIISGAAPLADVDEEPLTEDPDWVFSIDVDPVERDDTPGLSGLVLLKVTVKPQEGLGQHNEVEHRSPREFSLLRWVRSRSPEGTGGPSQLARSSLGDRQSLTNVEAGR